MMGRKGFASGSRLKFRVKELYGIVTINVIYKYNI